MPDTGIFNDDELEEFLQAMQDEGDRHGSEDKKDRQIASLREELARKDKAVDVYKTALAEANVRLASVLAERATEADAIIERMLSYKSGLSDYNPPIDAEETLASLFSDSAKLENTLYDDRLLKMKRFGDKIRTIVSDFYENISSGLHFNLKTFERADFFFDGSKRDDCPAALYQISFFRSSISSTKLYILYVDDRYACLSEDEFTFAFDRVKTFQVPKGHLEGAGYQVCDGDKLRYDVLTSSNPAGYMKGMFASQDIRPLVTEILIKHIGPKITNDEKNAIYSEALQRRPAP